ncbi:clotting factor G beta subunit [Ixodes scapularis]
MACVRMPVWILLLSVSVCHSATVDGHRVRRDSCLARHLSRAEMVDGRCMPVQECMRSLKDVGRLRSPIYCGIRGLRPIVCCPQPEEPATTSATATTTTATTTAAPTSAQLMKDPCQTENGQPGACMPLFDCKELEDQMSQGKFPPLCSIQKRVPYACCPRNETLPLEPIQVDVMARALKTSELDYENGLCSHFSQQTELRKLLVWRYAHHENHRLIRSSLLLQITYLARIGEVKISGTKKNSTLERNVTSVVVHPDYNERQHYADVALLVLDASARRRRLRRPFACLPDAGAEPDKDQAIVLGWGHNGFGGRVHTHLQEVRVPLVANDVCNESYSALENYAREFPRGVNDDFVCAGNLTYGGVDACQQDSGGPLVMETTRNGQKVLEVVGVVSFGVGCGSPNFPGVYARVSTYRDWILNKMTQVLPDSQIGLVRDF